MTFADIKDTILTGAKKAEVCGEYINILTALTEQDIIDSAVDLSEWAFRSGIIDDALLLEFNQANLNTNQIYVTGPFTLTDPVKKDIYVFGDAEVEINISTGQYNIFMFSSSVVNLNITGTGYAQVKVFNGTLNLVMEDDSVCSAEITESTSTAIINDGSVLHTKCYKGTNLDLTTNNTSYVKHQGFFNSNVTTIKNDTSEIQLVLTQTATQTDGGL